MNFVFADRPQRIYWEVTRACDLACRHCRAAAAPAPSPDQLSSVEALGMLRDLADFGDPLPHLVFTGGDPLKRDDLFTLIAAARGLGFGVSVAPSATPLLTPDALHQMRGGGVEAISLSIDGPRAEEHDAIRGIEGTFVRTIAAANLARAIGLPFQVNTLVCGDTVDHLDAVHDLVRSLGAARWSLFFLVGIGRGQVLEPISPARAEALLTWVATLRGSEDGRQLIITTTEAPHFRRVMAQRRRRESDGLQPAMPRGHAATGIRDGNGIMFISHEGAISPSGFLEIACGNVRCDSAVAVYRSSTLFTALRDPRAFRGRCGRCEFQWVCGGSRARAFAETGDPLAADPLCAYEPRSLFQ